MERALSDARAGFSLYLEAAGAGQRPRRFRESVGEEAVAGARADWSGRILDPETTADDVVRALGAPDERAPEELAYALPHRPGYLYVFQFARGGKHLLASFFRRRDQRSLPPLGAALAAAGATAEEVRAVLGAPSAVDGWWPNDTWHYASGLILNLRHGVVEDG